MWRVFNQIANRGSNVLWAISGFWVIVVHTQRVMKNIRGHNGKGTYHGALGGCRAFIVGRQEESVVT